MDGRPSEHILLESDDAAAEAVERAGAARARFELHNRVRRVRTELTLYENGVLGVRVTSARGADAERRFDLRHVDPRPLLARRPAATALRAAVCGAAVAVVLVLLGTQGVAPTATFVAAAAALVIGAACAAVYVYRAEERVRFVTRHGRVPVLTLVASIGCFRACRAVVPRLAAAVNEAVRAAGGDRNARLRAEVREHYRLRDAGVLTPTECIAAVQRILARFE